MTNTAAGYAIRTYRPGDETALVLLFNNENSSLAGFVPRTVEYWRWCCLKRPDVDEEGIMIMENADKIVGYSVVGRSGNVWELCADSYYDTKMIISKLLTRSLDYARSAGSDSLVLNASTRDKMLRRACRELDFAESPPEPEFLSVFDLPQLAREILQSKNLNSDADGIFWLYLKNCPTWCTPSFGVRLEKKQVALLSEPLPASRITIETEMSTLVALIFGTESIFRAMISSKIHFSPFWRISKVLKLLRMLQIKTPWFVPRADIG